VIAVVISVSIAPLVTKVTNFPMVAMVMRTCKHCFTRQTFRFLKCLVRMLTVLLAVLSVISFWFLVVVPR
jgi:hypothetical protein